MRKKGQAVDSLTTRAVSENKKMNREQKLQAAEEVVRRIKDQVSGPFIPRRSIPDVTNRLYSVGHMANCDSSGTGPEGSFKLGRQMVYPVNSFCDWLVSRLEV